VIELGNEIEPAIARRVPLRGVNNKEDGDRDSDRDPDDMLFQKLRP
jgi:hypothetical protein